MGTGSGSLAGKCQFGGHLLGEKKCLEIKLTVYHQYIYSPPFRFRKRNEKRVIFRIRIRNDPSTVVPSMVVPDPEVEVREDEKTVLQLKSFTTKTGRMVWQAKKTGLTLRFFGTQNFALPPR